MKFILWLSGLFAGYRGRPARGGRVSSVLVGTFQTCHRRLNRERIVSPPLPGTEILFHMKSTKYVPTLAGPDTQQNQTRVYATVNSL